MWTPVHYATAAGHLEVVQMLSESPDTRQHLMENTLSYKSIEYNIGHVAINEGHLNITKYFMSVKTSTEEHLSLLLSVHDLNTMKYLLETFKYTQLSKQCALFVGTTTGKVDSMKYLIDTHNCDPSLRNELSNTPLHVAAAYKQLDVVKYLIEEQGCDPNVANDCGWIPLHAASGMGHKAVVKYLVESHYCSPYEKTLYHNLPIHNAALHGQLQVIKYFIEDMHAY